MDDDEIEIRTPAVKSALQKADIDMARRLRNKGRVGAGHDKRPSLYAAIQRDAVLGWTGVIPKAQVHRDADLSRRPDLSQIASDFLRMAGMNVPPTKAGKIAAGMRMANDVERSYSVDDFPSWLGNTAQMATTRGYDTATEVWKFITSTWSVNDFRKFDVVSMPEFPSPAETVENGPVSHMTLGSDSKESASLVSHTALFGISRQALTNGDLDTVSTIPQSMGRAASRAVGDKVFSVIAANAALSDSVAWFHATHGNLVAAAGPTATSLGVSRAALTAQTGPSGSILNLRPEILLGPSALSETLVSLRTSMVDNADDRLTPGYIEGKFAVLTDARMDDTSATVWYSLCDPAKHAGLVVAFLQGGEQPLVEQTDKFVTDQVDYRLMHDFQVLPVDYRSWVKNPGA